MKADRIVKPSSLEQAYEILISEKSATILGGGLFLRLQKKHFTTLIDCSHLLSSEILIGDVISIGSMTSLRDIETNLSLPKGLNQSVKQISGVGVRNLATIGGSVYGRYPFSDINTMLVALDATLTFFNSGKISMRKYNEEGLKEKDILLEISFRAPQFSASAFYKKVYTDFSLINLSVSNNTLAIGARPMRPIYLEHVDFSKSPKEILSEVEFGSDFKGSKEYRRALCEARLEDLIYTMGGHHEN
ncbi:MAG: FAD binding domain-containing protein [Clostridia bacterium]|nr:FAD binding domain-containing protein [Clostridia bacterium]